MIASGGQEDLWGRFFVLIYIICLYAESVSGNEFQTKNSYCRNRHGSVG